MKKRFAFVLLLGFLSVSSFIHFFHTDVALLAKDFCPACHFQNTIPNLDSADVCSCQQQPELFLVGTLPLTDVNFHPQVVLENPSSRSPPRIKHVPSK